MTTALEARQCALTRTLMKDHEQFRQQIKDLTDLMQKLCCQHSMESLEPVRQQATALVDALNTHAICEEKGLFEALRQKHPICILEFEHEEILLKRAAFHSGLNNFEYPKDCNGDLYSRALAFFDLLERHMTKEEQAIFPLMEKALTPQEKLGILLKIEEIQAVWRVAPLKESELPRHEFVLFQIPTEANHPYEVKSLLDKNGWSVKSLRLAPGKAQSPHWSPSPQVMLMFSGLATFHTHESEVQLQTGDGLYIDSKLIHWVEAISDCSFLVFALQGEASRH